MKLLIAYDKDTSFSNVLSRGIQRAKVSDGYVYLVRTCEPGIKEDELLDIERRMKEICQEVFEAQKIKSEFHILIRGMTPGEDIVNYAKEKKVDEIIIGIKKRSKVGKLLFGSNAQYIILEAHCPVLCVK